MTGVKNTIPRVERHTCERKALNSSTHFCVHVVAIVEERRGDGKSCRGEQ